MIYFLSRDLLYLYSKYIYLENCYYFLIHFQHILLYKFYFHYLVWMIRAPNAIRRGLATLPVSLGNSLAYFISNSSHGMRSAILIQRLSGFMWRPKGWLKSRNECCNLSIGLYIVLAPLCSKSVKNCKKNDLFSSKSLQSLYQKMEQKSKNQVFTA